MLFNSYIFMLAFLPVFIIVYFALRHFGKKGSDIAARTLRLWIVAASLIFYAFFGYRNVLVLLISILLNGLIINGIRAGSNQKKLWLIIGVVINTGLLAFFKYSGTFFPVAISFYTFNQISYTVDWYRGEIKEFDLLDYLAYILFFSKLLQGPLMGYGDFEKELDKAKGEKFDAETMLRGLLLVALGLFKKVILADTFGKAVDYGFENAAALGSLEAVLVAVFYSFQLYFDFSGYCDVAGGICMMMGFDLPVNFDSPYKAVNITDFWKRWHITLTRFFTRYVYIPLGGNRRGEARTCANLLIVFFLSGLWHGSGWTFVIWGMMHGVLYVVTRVLHDHAKGKGTSGRVFGGRLLTAFKVAMTFIYVTAAWVFFRASTAKEAITLFARMFTGGLKPIASGLASCFQLDELWYIIKVTPIMNYDFAWNVCLWIFLTAGAAIIFLGKSAISYSKECRIGIKTTLLTAVLLVWCIVSFAGVSTYLYMNF